jgi:hypothetical protein
LIAALIGREQMSTPDGQTNSGPLPHPKKLETPTLGSVIQTDRGRRVFPVFTLPCRKSLNLVGLSGEEAKLSKTQQADEKVGL